MNSLQPLRPPPPPKPPQPPSPAPHPSSSPADESRLSRHSALLFTPPVLQKIRQIKPIIQLRPPDIHAVQPNLHVHRLFRRRILQLAKLLLGNQQPPPVAQLQHQELKPRLRPLCRL